MSQAVFARVLHVSAKSVQSWEQGLRSPSKATRRLIQIFAERPDVVCEVVGVTSLSANAFRVQTIKGRRRLVKSD